MAEVITGDKTDEQRLILAIKLRELGEDRIVCRHSSLVSDEDDIFTPVSAALDAQCSELISSREEEDEHYYWGHVRVLEYRLLSACPGTRVNHRCTRSKGVAA